MRVITIELADRIGPDIEIGTHNWIIQVNKGVISKIIYFFKNFSFKKSESETEIGLSFEDVVKLKKYPIEKHIVQTEDGYLLTVFRIPGGKNEVDYNQKNKQIVYLQHGLFDSSDCWITNHEKLSIAFILANRGFDVWLGNSRGNKYSRAHVEISPEEEKFWDYSFHEMGLKDLPASLNFIMDKTQSKRKIIYIGHSQGGAMILAGLSVNLEYFKEKLLCVIGLSPASRIDNVSSNFFLFLANYDLDEKVLRYNIHEVFPYQPELSKIKGYFFDLNKTLCLAMLEMNSDEDSLVNCPERAKLYLTRYPCGTSVKSCKHFKQIYLSKRFQMYDFEDKSKNQEIYGQESPLAYDLKKIKGIPIVICGGMKDKMVDINDLRWLKEEIKETLFSYHEYKYFGHAAFLIGNDIHWFNDVLKDIYKIMDLKNI